MTRLRLLSMLLAAAAVPAAGALILGGAEEPVVVEAASAPAPQSFADINAPYDGKYHFARIYYGDGGRPSFARRRGGAPWSHDYPRAELNFLQIMDELTYTGTQTEGSNVIALDDPELFKFPIAYIVEVGYWNPTDEEIENLGNYLNKGGFLIVDDTRQEWGGEFQNFEFHMQRALPGLDLVMLDHEHEVFDSFFRVDPNAVIPPYGRYPPMWYGIFEDNDPKKRLMVVFNFNNDIAEYWEFSERGYYPIDLSNEAYKLGVNYIVYALTH